MHRDLKPDNILLKFIGSQELIVITDFGASFKPESGLTTVKDLISVHYAPLEQQAKFDAHSSYDIWSIGIIAYNLMAKKLPYPQQDAT